MKTLYLHIGSPKTGTTSIQHFCYDNREALEAKGYSYPKFSYPYSNKRSRLDFKRNALFLQAMFMDEEGVRHKDREEEILKDGLARLQELFHKFDYIILSDEGIWRAAAGRRKSIWKELREEGEKGGFTVKIIAYVRKQDELLESWWNQTVKHGISKSNVLTWEEYQEVYPKYINLDYYALLKAAADELGVENVVVRRFHRDFFKDGRLLDDFLDILGLEMSEEFQIDDQSVKNNKMSENFCAIKRIINGMTEVQLPERWRYERLLRELSPRSNQEYPCRMFSAKEVADFMKKYEESNQRLYETFIADGKPLFMEKENPPEKWQEDNPHMLDDLVRFIVACDLDRKAAEARIKEEVRIKEETRIKEENAGLRKRLAMFLKRIWNRCKKLVSGKS